jgi:hypothetical protein
MSAPNIPFLAPAAPASWQCVLFPARQVTILVTVYLVMVVLLRSGYSPQAALDLVQAGAGAALYMAQRMVAARAPAPQQRSRWH